MSKLIYEPRGRALEFSGQACNLYRGCSHGCLYCYAPGFVRESRDSFTWARVRSQDVIKRLTAEVAAMTAGQNQLSMFSQPQTEKLRVFLSFTTDPYQALERDLFITKQAIAVLHHYGIAVDILTKNPMLAATRDVGLLTRDDTVGATLTFPSTDTRDQLWEPGAPSNKNRIDGLEELHRHGIRVWAALEPVLDAEDTLAIIAEVAPFVEHFKVGALNHTETISRQALAQLPRFDGFDFLQKATSLFESLSFERTYEPGTNTPGTYYIKRSLAYHEQ